MLTAPLHLVALEKKGLLKRNELGGLMGWPAGWSSATALPASSAAAMESYRFRLRQQLSCLFTE